MIPEPPSGTSSLFGERFPQVVRYVELLVGEAAVRGVIGPREAARVWDRHIRNSLAVLPFLTPGEDVIDLGSGAGLPGIPVALARPDLRVVLLEATSRRVAFLRQAVAAVPVPNATVVHGRAETVDLQAPSVVCRAVAPAADLIRYAHRLTGGAGRLVALKGARVGDEVEQIDRRLRPSCRPASIEVKQVSWPDPAVVLLAEWNG